MRDELGNPIAGPGVDIEMTTQAGVRLKAKTFPTDGRGNNYRLIIPMDSGTTAVPYTRYAQSQKHIYDRGRRQWSNLSPH